MRQLEYHQRGTPAPPRGGLLPPLVCLALTAGLLAVARTLPGSSRLTAAAVGAADATAAVGVITARRALDTDREGVIAAAMCLLIGHVLIAIARLLVLIAALLR